MGTWTSTTRFDGQPTDLLDVLTDVEAIERWSPVRFDVDGARQLRAGARLAVHGGLLGRSVSFDVDVVKADETGLELHARGAFDIFVDYAIDPQASRVTARVKTDAGRPVGRLLASAANAMLSAGALERVLRRVVSEASCASEMALA